MKTYTLNDWQDYWKIFDELIALLTDDNKTEIIAAFNQAKRYVNGLTDGWYDYKFAFEKVLNANKENMNNDQIDIAEFLLLSVNQSLKRQL